ncbi:hypothetical protein HGP28_08965 [Vibrio sp. SM6]|uniref:Uncharacterized protein n=1 Tax=Vibrio agarilyticus TaxID=2726741 RepID=A0A7X8TQC8_9VIBR|nr:hypothetical protein [Vibrio agarilyticus]NLS13017.1 hypothetical protein [Vibrio agarilyticus]
MQIEFSRKEMDHINKYKGDYSDKRYIRQLIREDMKKKENEESQGANNETKRK